MTREVASRSGQSRLAHTPLPTLSVRKPNFLPRVSGTPPSPHPKRRHTTSQGIRTKGEKKIIHKITCEHDSLSQGRAAESAAPRFRSQIPKAAGAMCVTLSVCHAKGLPLPWTTRGSVPREGQVGREAGKRCAPALSLGTEVRVSHPIARPPYVSSASDTGQTSTPYMVDTRGAMGLPSSRSRLFLFSSCSFVFLFISTRASIIIIVIKRRH